ncbi:hypothetical protein N9O57_00700 [bacterium]|nr:hypothetical protein [bacterium]
MKTILRYSLITIFMLNPNSQLYSFDITASYYERDSPDWSSDAKIPSSGSRENIYNLEENELWKKSLAGTDHAYIYPVEISGLFIPFDSFVNFLDSEQDNKLKEVIYSKVKKTSGVKSSSDFFKWLGLQEFPSEKVLYPNPVIIPPIMKDNFEKPYMGASIVDTPLNTKGLTFSCATCHSQNLFGTPVIGLTNKRPRANSFFMLGKIVVPLISTAVYKKAMDASDEEILLLKRSKKNFKAVDAVSPKTRGLDASLAQVALSLSRRKQDAYASKSSWLEKFPRKNPLSTIPADSKASVWWNVKYKTRWLSDGSIVSGNPVLTNILWNEIGRGTDLKELEQWMKDNREKIEELTTALFANKAPRIENFFTDKKIDIEKAKKGEIIFQNSCQDCHGQYVKAWSKDPREVKFLTNNELIQTTQTIYHEQTPVIDVKTDPYRYQGMQYFEEDLNRLKISKWINAKVVTQKGYVPPPLDGIWSRYPYLHNGSIPNLCDLMTPPNKRVKFFIQGPSENKETDYDYDCVGYPTAKKIPPSWYKLRDSIYKTQRRGMRNIGHYKMFLDKSGQELYTKEDKRNLREFLKTL